MRYILILTLVVNLPMAISAQQVIEPEVQSSAQTGGRDDGKQIDQDPTSLAGRGGQAIRQKTYQATIGTAIGTNIRTEIGTAIGVPH